jgi:integrase
MRKNLTDLTVRSLAPGTYFDIKTPAFGIRVGKHRKTWIVVRAKVRIQTIVGHYPSMPLSEARTEAKKLLVQTPLQRNGITLAEALPLFIDDHYRDRRDSTKTEVERVLSKHFRVLESMKLSDITDAHIERELRKLDHIPSEKLHAFRYVRVFLKWCTRPPRRFIPHSPLEGYEAPGKDRKRSRILTDDELRAVWLASSGTHGAMTRLITLWGTRRGETIRLRREWLAGGILTIPGTVTKNGRPHAIPLLPAAQAILDDQRNNSPYFFPSRLNPHAHTHPSAWDERHRELLKASGTAGWTAHDLRRTFRSLCARLGVPREVAERLLNHARDDLDEIYNHHDYLPEKRVALAKIEAHIHSLLPRDQPGIAMPLSRCCDEVYEAHGGLRSHQPIADGDHRAAHSGRNVS